MNQTIWQKLNKPFFVLAPMENVTDTVFRQIVASAGKPDMFFTEFVSTAGLCSGGFNRVKRYLEYTNLEKPLIAQIWGNDPEKFYKTGKMLSKMEFDGIDINMGCPVRKIINKGSCGGLIGNQTLSKEIILAVKEGAGSASRRIPVSVKTRIGINKVITEEWIGFLLKQDLDAITIHVRTVKDMSKVPAKWDEIGKAVVLRDQMKSGTLIIGNGDINSREEGLNMFKKYGVDGIMVGRGIFHNLWLFTNKDPGSIPQKEKIKLLIDHISLFEKTWGKDKNFEIMKKFYKIYINGIPDANKIRMELMGFKTAGETLKYLKELSN